MAETKPKAGDDTKKAEVSTIPQVGEVLTAEAFAALREQIAKEVREDTVGAVFSIPGAKDSLEVGLHEQLKAGVPTDLRDAPVPEGAVAVYCATDVRAVLPSGDTYLFVANVVKHVPKHAVKALRAFGVAEYTAAESK